MNKKMVCVAALLVSLFATSPALAQTDSLLLQLFNANTDPIFREVTSTPEKYRLQIIYTRINRDKKNIPSFQNFYFHHDPQLYFNPASMVKMPLAFLSLEKINALHKKNVTKNTTILFDSSEIWQHPLYSDTTARNGLPSIAHFIKRAFLISENDPYNRMYQWVGQQQTNRSLHEKGYPGVRITRQFLGLTSDQNRRTNGIRMVDKSGKTLYQQSPLVNTDSFDFSHVYKIGKAYYDRNDSLVNEPFDFTQQNVLPLLTMQQLMQSVLFPESVPLRQRFNLTNDDYRFLYRYLSQFPSETADPKYDTSKFYDSYVKFFFRDSTRHLPGGVRVFNKVGWSYGFLTDVSYVVDFKNNVEFMLAATLYVNRDEIINDDQYEYDSIGHPFLYQLGRTIYEYELKRPRMQAPNLSKFRIKYEKRDPADNRPSLFEVDN